MSVQAQNQSKQEKDIESQKKDRTQVQGQIQNIQNSEDQLYVEDESIEEEENTNYMETIKNKYYFIIAYFFDFIYLVMIPVILITFGFAIGVTEMFQCQFSSIPRLLWMIIVSVSVIYCQISFFFIDFENFITFALIQDGIFFYASSMLVFSFLIANYEPRYDDICDAMGNGIFEKVLSTFQYLNQKNTDKVAYFLDFRDFFFIEEIVDFANKQTSTQKIFNYLTLNQTSHEISQLQSTLYNSFHKYIKPSFGHFLLLLSIITIKLFLAIRYLNIFSNQLTIKDILNIVLVIFIYIYTTFNLNRILGNNDLKRKSMVMEEIKTFVDFSDDNEKDWFQKKLDITCPISIETWDNARKVILSYQKEYLQDLELSYFCLIFYYLFVILIIFSAYFELYWIIPKDSTLLQPIEVILSTFNFVFLSTFLLLRFYEGQRFNNTFDDHSKCIVQLIDVMEDLLTMFDTLFIEKNRSLVGIKKIEQEKTYGVLIEKIKQTSSRYIKEGIKYQGRIYTREEKNLLRRKMIKNARVSIKKVKKQIDSDSLTEKYMFLNLIEIKFSDFLITLIFGLVTTLPTIVPKFLNFFVKE